MSASRRVLVINPNSNPQVTQGISKALQPLRIAGGPEIECVTLADGPFGVETQEHVEQVSLRLRRLASERPLNLSVAESERPEAIGRLFEVAALLRDTDGADVLVLGCAGMARHRQALEAALGLPVIGPTQAAADAPGAVLLA